MIKNLPKNMSEIDKPKHDEETKEEKKGDKKKSKKKDDKKDDNEKKKKKKKKEEIKPYQVTHKDEIVETKLTELK